MVGFLRWAGSVVTGTLSGFARFVFALALILLVAMVWALARGDGLPANMVLTLDLRGTPADSAPSDFALGGRPLTVMDIVLGLDAAGRDDRVKGAYLRLGTSDMSVARAEELAQALKRFRAAGKFVLVHAQAFGDSMGDYLVASAADEIWMQPNSFFQTAGLGGGKIYLRGLLDKIGVVPQLSKRAEYKSAADQIMATGMSEADREQTMALLQANYDSAVAESAAGRKLDQAVLRDVFEKSPQSSDDAKKAKLIDRLGFDDDAMEAAMDRAGHAAEEVGLGRYASVGKGITAMSSGTKVALINAAGVIMPGRSESGLFETVIGSDDIAGAIREAAKDEGIKAIMLRVDSPGGSVVASDQILDAVKKAQKAGKPVVVSMGSVAASGGYYISLSADKIVAEPATMTGSIGVITGKLSYDKTLEKLGIKVETVGIGRNALIDTPYQPYSEDQWQKIDKQTGAIYADFTGKVAKGRKLPIEKVEEIAKGRIWSGRDAMAHGLVDRLGGFWAAVDETRKLVKLDKNARLVFVEYPRPQGLLAALRRELGGAVIAVEAMGRFVGLLQTPAGRAARAALADAPSGEIEMRAVGLPR